MSGLGSKIKKLLQNAKELILKGKDRLIDNKKLVGIVVLVVILVIAGVLFFTRTKKEKEKVVDTSVETVSGGDVQEEPLEENAYPEVNELVQKYYTALADGDMDTVVSCRNYTEDTEKIRLQKKSEYIEKYENLTCYTKKGLLENTYLAYVYYEVKFNDIDTLAPALNTLYICPNEEGKLYIYDSEIDDNVSDYLKALSTQDDVLDLFNRVQVSYNEAIEKDEKLNTFLSELPTKIKTEVGEALAALESEDSQTTEQPATEETQEATEQQAEEQTPTTETVVTTDTVNVRSSDSETADKVGKAAAGEQFVRVEARENGWSKIQFEGKEAFVKSEYLKTVDANAEEAAEQPAEAAGTQTTQGKVTAKETVNVRKSASETADKLGVAYQGDQFELIMKQADGWSKINYKGQTGFVKSEFVE